jgi:methionyl-tRNA synthetase
LIDAIKKGEEIKILPETRRNEVLGFLENNALQDLCISRPKSRLGWGIPSPISEQHVTYVWFDALINYISACGYGQDEMKLKKWWPADVHIIGKDILRHHAVYWTILLKALDLPLPRMIFAHGWWVQDGEKMSKSRGNATDSKELITKYRDVYRIANLPIDAYRYFFLRETPFGQDGAYSDEAFIQRYNADLANGLGNLLSRTLTMCEKYFKGNVPTISLRKNFLKGLSFEDAQKDSEIQQNNVVYTSLMLAVAVDDLFKKIPPLMERLAFSEALEEIWLLVGKANEFIEKTTPWSLAKQGHTEALQLVITSLFEVLKVLAQAVWPFMPFTGESIWTQLGIKTPLSGQPFKSQAWGFFEKGSKTAKSTSLFPRIETPHP